MIKMVEPRTVKGILRYDDQYDTPNLNLWGDVTFNGEEIQVKSDLTDVLRGYEGKTIEVQIKVIEG